MILIITRKDDLHCDLVMQQLEARAAHAFRLNTDAPHEYEVCLSPRGGWLEHFATGRRTDLAAIRSVWVRRRSIPEGVAKANRSFVEREWQCLYGNLWWLLRECYWMSSPRAIEDAKWKLRQLDVAERVGFAVPSTRFSNALRALASLQQAHEACIYKPHEAGYIDEGHTQSVYTSVIPRAIAPEDANVRERLRICPGLFQPYIQKSHELRVTVVAANLFATRLDSQAVDGATIDWRRVRPGSIEHTAVELPKELSERCIQLVAELGLQFGALDLIVTPDGSTVFLEVNANGQWAWIELTTQQAIAAAIADALIAANCS